MILSLPSIIDTGISTGMCLEQVAGVVIFTSLTVFLVLVKQAGSESCDKIKITSLLRHWSQ